VAQKWQPITSRGLQFRLRTRREASISAFLRGMGHEDFFPTYKNRTRRSDGIKETNASLFPGYVFCRFNPQNRLPILKTPGVIQVVSNGRSLIPVSDSEIEVLKVASASDTHCEPWPYLEVGVIVRIEARPLLGCRGILVHFRGGQQLILSVNLLQRSVAVAIEASAVRLEQQLVGEFRLSGKLPGRTSPNAARDCISQGSCFPI
jgi:transcription antitermination factor NusG